ncbi:hypothetical protein PsYK624_081310 [Phanerochaete sordida]|uniref:Uncharacterized protein n=1 Tax=Phanerochaete sordida TaxID=48140 RepID=A0A9P3GCS1_9APHY|nr:hypothetical protein PsYK624_081310 [Phanerochaete sordida]
MDASRKDLLGSIGHHCGWASSARTVIHGRYTIYTLRSVIPHRRRMAHIWLDVHPFRYPAAGYYVKACYASCTCPSVMSCVTSPGMRMGCYRRYLRPGDEGDAHLMHGWSRGSAACVT